MTKKIATDKTAEKQFVFNNANIDEIIDKMSQGFSLPRYMNPWFKNQIGVRKSGCVYEWTKHEVDEFTKCALDIHYFANNYCKIKSEDGQVRQMKLRDYQYDVLDAYTKNRFTLNMSSRQTGKTITAAITLLHYCIFNTNKGLMIVANKGDTVVEILDKIKNIYKLLPFFLKPGLINWNSKSMVFDNGCRIKSQARSKEPAIGFTIDFLYMDEFAHIPKNIITHYYKAAIPTVSSIKGSKIVITSTPNGANLFKDLVMGASVPDNHPERNMYKLIKVLWWQVPDGKFADGTSGTRLDAKLYPINDEFLKYNLTVNEAILHFEQLGFKCVKEIETTDTGEKEYIRILHNPGISDIETIRTLKMYNTTILKLFSITSWHEQEVKLIGGDENFNQEYNCFTGDTLITTMDGLKAIKDVKVGDYVLTHTNRFRRVLGTINTPYDGYLNNIYTNGNNRPLKVTDEHPIRVCNDGANHNWINAENLTLSDNLCYPNGMITPIKKIETQYYVGDVYNLEVEIDNSYVAEGRVVHNCLFIAGSKRVLSANKAKILEDRQIKYTHKEIEQLNRLQFDYDQLRWAPDYIEAERNNYYWIPCIDTSEGLAQDDSVMNIFRLAVRDAEWLKENKIKTVYDAFYLKQQGIYNYNKIDPESELPELFYLLFFNYFNPERVKAICETNGPGTLFMKSIPHVFEQNNNYGNYVFVRFLHKIEDKIRKIGNKITRGNKKTLVKKYIDAVESDKIYVDEMETLNQMDNFIKVETRSGDYTYKADSGHDDIVMTNVHAAAFLDTQDYKNICMQYYNELPSDIQNLIDSSLNLEYNPNAISYKAASNALSKSKNSSNKRYSSNNNVGRFNR